MLGSSGVQLEEFARWSFEGCKTFEEKKTRLIRNFAYFVNKTLYPQCIEKYGLNLTHKPALSCKIVSTQPDIDLATNHAEAIAVNKFYQLEFNHKISLKKKFKKTLDKFYEAMLEFLSEFLGPDQFIELIGGKIWDFTNKGPIRTVDLLLVRMFEGFIMEGKSTVIDSVQARGTKVIMEPDSLTRAKGLNGQSILADHADLIPLIYFLQFSQVCYSQDKTIVCDRSALSFVPFNKLNVQESFYGTDDLFSFWLYTLAFCGCHNITIVTFKRTTPETPFEELVGRDFEKQLYKTPKLLAAKRKVFYDLLDTQISKLLGVVDRLGLYNQLTGAKDDLAENEMSDQFGARSLMKEIVSGLGAHIQNENKKRKNE